MKRKSVSLVSCARAIVALLATACNSGSSGAPGPTGATGPVGPTAAEGTGSGSCTVPCHGFENGIVSQWRSSKHYAASALALATETAQVVSNTQYCGGCHATDGLELRVAGQVSTLGDAGATNVMLGHLNYTNPDGGVSVVLYTGDSNSSLIHCKTCHAFDKDNDPHVVGKFQQVPLRVPSGEDHVFLEKSADPDAGVTGTQLPTAYGPANTCIFCHKSPRDVSFYVTGRATPLTSHWGPHNGTQADVFTGEGGYRWPGQTYDMSIHSEIPNGCSKCHMPPVAENNNLPDHSFLPRLSACGGASNCHQGAIASFDLAVSPHDPKTQGGQTVVRALLLELRALLCPPGPVGDASADAGDTADGGGDDAALPASVPCLLSRTDVVSPASAPPLSDAERVDDNFPLDVARLTTPPIVMPKPYPAALFDYLLVSRSRDEGVHNPIYTQQLLWDTIHALTGSPPASMPTRPTPLSTK